MPLELPIIGYEDRYVISDDGCIFTLNWKRSGMRRLLVSTPTKKGYHIVSLYDGSGKQNRAYRYVHRLVALAFIPNPLRLPQVNHIDGERAHNSVTNLEWCDGATNVALAHDNILAGAKRGIDCSNAGFTEEQVRDIKRRLLHGENCCVIARAFRSHRATIHSIKCGRTWSHITA